MHSSCTATNTHNIHVGKEGFQKPLAMVTVPLFPYMGFCSLKYSMPSPRAPPPSTPSVPSAARSSNGRNARNRIVSAV